jgi:hypothetical protein
VFAALAHGTPLARKGRAMRELGDTGRSVALGFVGAAVLLACTGAARTTTEPAGEPVAFVTLAQAAVPGQSGGAVQEVVRDPAAFQALWTQLTAGSSLDKTPPAVDFGRQMVVVAALPTQSCVAKVTIQGIAREASSLRVDLLEQYPGPSCRCIVSSRPFHVVSLARIDGAVRFNATRGPDTC